MKTIQKQIKSLKSQFGDKISTSIRNKIDRYNALLSQMFQNPVFKTIQEGCGHQKIMSSIQKQISELKKDIESEIKLSMTDYQAFIWKTHKICNASHPECFNHLQQLKPEKPSQESINTIHKNFNFPILKTKNEELITIATKLIETNQFCQQNYTHSTILNLCFKICSGYRIVPYHNFSHAFSLFLMLFQCREASQKFKKGYSPLQFFSAYIAALAHDLSHTGFNSYWQIKNKTQLALAYNNESVLEHMHASELHRIFRENPEIDILSSLRNTVQRQTAKRLITTLILATDASFHSQYLKQFKDAAHKAHDFDNLQSSQKEVILQNMVHSCDIGNPALDFDNYMNWSLLLAHEFDTQAKKQKERGLQISVNFEYVNLETHYRRQIGFIEFMAYPLWKQIGLLFPELSFLERKMHENTNILKNKTAANQI